MWMILLIVALIIGVQIFSLLKISSLSEVTCERQREELRKRF